MADLGFKLSANNLTMNNIRNVIAQVGSGNDREYTDLTPTS